MSLNSLYCLKICPVEGCNRFCKFCGGYSIWKTKEDRKYKFMDLELAEKMAFSFGNEYESKRISIGQFGEPLLHPNIFDIIQAFRSYGPSHMQTIFSNGLCLIENGADFICEIFAKGIDFLIIDTYTKGEEIRKVVKKSKIKMIDFYKDKPKSFPGFMYQKPGKEKVIVIVDDLGSKAGIDRRRGIVNSAGNSNPKILKKYGIFPIVNPIESKCVRPFREMIVCHDGAVPICCIDWKRDCLLGVFTNSISKIWNSKSFQAVRYLLYNKKRIFNPCYKCDFSGGNRRGFLKCPEEVDYGYLERMQKRSKYKSKYSVDPFWYDKGLNGITSFLRR